MEKVLEFVSPIKTKWKILTDQERDLHRNTPMHGENMTVKRKTRVGKKSKSNKKAQGKPQMLKMHRLLLNCDNHAQKGENVAESRTQLGDSRGGICRNPDGSKTEPRTRLRES